MILFSTLDKKHKLQTYSVGREVYEHQCLVQQEETTPKGDDNMISSDWTVLDCFTDWNDSKAGLTPAGELPFHLHIEVLGLDRKRQREGRKR